jgi:hypothetical protein
MMRRKGVPWGVVWWFQQFLWCVAGQKRIVEKRWLEFFSDPSQWWDHRTAKVNEINFFRISLLSRKSQRCSWFS